MKILKVVVSGGKPEVLELEDSINLRAYIENQFHAPSQTVKPLNEVEVQEETKVMAVYLGTASEAHECVIINGKIIYSDVFIVKLDHSGLYSGLNDSEIELYQGRLYR